MTGMLIRKTEPHQKNCSSTPPISGPIAPPAEKLAIHTPTAKVRCFGSRNMERSSDRVEGASVAAASPRSARAAMSPPTLVRMRRRPTRNRTRLHRSAAAGVGRCGHRERPWVSARLPVRTRRCRQSTKLGTARTECRAELRHGEIQYREVHGVEQAWKCQHRKPNPLAGGGFWTFLTWVTHDVKAQGFVIIGLSNGLSTNRQTVHPLEPAIVWRPCSLELDSLGAAAFETLCDGFGACPRAELAEQGFDVKLDRVQRDVETQGDRLIAETRGNRRQHIDFAGREQRLGALLALCAKAPDSRAGRTQRPAAALRNAASICAASASYGSKPA